MTQGLGGLKTLLSAQDSSTYGLFITLHSHDIPERYLGDEWYHVEEVLHPLVVRF